MDDQIKQLLDEHERTFLKLRIAELEEQLADAREAMMQFQSEAQRMFDNENAKLRAEVNTTIEAAKSWEQEAKESRLVRIEFQKQLENLLEQVKKENAIYWPSKELK